MSWSLIRAEKLEFQVGTILPKKIKSKCYLVLSKTRSNMGYLTKIQTYLLIRDKGIVADRAKKHR